MGSMIIDNGSEDDTKSRIQELSQQVTYPLHYIYEPDPGLHNCRHSGSKEAKGNIIAYLDDDMKLSKSWLHVASLCLEGKADGVIGRIYPDYDVRYLDGLIGFLIKKILATLGF